MHKVLVKECQIMLVDCIVQDISLEIDLPVVNLVQNMFLDPSLWISAAKSLLYVSVLSRSSSPNANVYAAKHGVGQHMVPEK